MSTRKLEANRNNARASTGPKTAAGKARVARNAFQHGLSVSVLADPNRSEDVRIAALSIAGQDASREAQEFAFRFVAAQFDLIRVRQAGWELIARELDSSHTTSCLRKLAEIAVANLSAGFERPSIKSSILNNKPAPSRKMG